MDSISRYLDPCCFIMIFYLWVKNILYSSEHCQVRRSIFSKTKTKIKQNIYFENRHKTCYTFDYIIYILYTCISAHDYVAVVYVSRVFLIPTTETDSDYLGCQIVHSL